MALSEDEKSLLKLAQLYKAIWDGKNTKIMDKILEKEGDINFVIPLDGLCRITRPHIRGSTALHLACTHDLGSLFTSLLSRGADFTKKNKDGETALHKLVRKQDIKEPLDKRLVNAVLSAHVNSNNFTNPCDRDGFSHFHAACTTTHLTAVKFFLDNGVSVDEPNSMAAKSSPGYTPLHFAAMCANTKVVEILLAHGANTHATDATGITALHILIKRRLEILDSMKNKPETSDKKLQEQVEENEKIINMLLENTSSDNDGVDRIGLSNFHVACILQDTSAAEHLADRVADINHQVNMDSRLWPGYTALHFAAHVSIGTVKILMNKEANVEVKDLQGLTPLDICIERYKIEDICHIMSLNANWRNISFSDGEAELLTFVHTLAELKLFRKFMNHPARDMNMHIPLGSPLWPGYTPLHLAVLFAEKGNCEPRKAKEQADLQIIRVCLKNGADLNLQDSRGRTALHLAFRLNKMTVVDVILRHSRQILSVLDEDSLSHLHIVCAVGKRKHAFKKCALNREVLNVAYTGTSPVNAVRPGATPLHAYLVKPDDNEDVMHIIKILLKNGADLSAKDAYGLTPIHWLLAHQHPLYDTRILLNPPRNDCVADEFGLSYLHVACHLRDVEAVRRLLENGANPNLAIKYTRRGYDDPLSFLSRYDKCTPLHFSASLSTAAMLMLLDRGADVLARKADGSTALESLTLYYFVERAWRDADLQRRMEREFGWTRLHLACYLLEVDGFEDIVQAESANVNARVFSSSPVWGGCTPLHLSMRRTRGVSDALRTLLDTGADVTAMDEEQNTPVTMLFKYSVDDEARELAALLMRHHRDFNSNPVGAYGMTHFHVACYVNDVEAVRGFLEHGVDVNRPIDYFAYWCAGYTPLHLASQIELVDLLVGHGADIHAEDVHGRSALFEALKRDAFDEAVVAKIIECGADINTPNFGGETPFEVAISVGEMTIAKLDFCIRQGFHVNSCNPITGVGYIALTLTNRYLSRDAQMLMADEIMKENSINAFGRTTLHHLVTKWISIPENDYYLLLEKVIESGCGIDDRDNEGKTALHVAVEFTHGKAVNGLLMSGADINVVDVNGTSALSCASIQSRSTNPDSESIASVLTIHALRLVLLNLDLSMDNTNAIADTSRSIRDYADNRDFHMQIARSKEIEVGGGSIRLYDFLSETGAVSSYPRLKREDRDKIDEFFASISTIDSSLKDINAFLKLQYRKSVDRLELLPSAIESFRLLLGFVFPDLCAENTFKYLQNSDLKNIISAQIENDVMRMDVD